MRSQEDPAHRQSDAPTRARRRQTDAVAGPGVVNRWQRLVGNRRVTAALQRKSASAEPRSEESALPERPPPPRRPPAPERPPAPQRHPASPRPGPSARPEMPTRPAPQPLPGPDVEAAPPPQRLTPQPGAVSAEEGAARLAEAVARTRAELDAVAPPPVAAPDSPGARLVVAAVTGAAQAGRAALVAAAGEAVQAVSGTVGEQSALVEQARAEQVAGVAADAARTRSRVGAAVGEQTAAVAGASAAERDRVTAWRAAGAARAQEEVAARADRVREMGVEREQQAVAAGETAAGQAAGDLTGAAARSRDHTAGGGGDAAAEGRAEVTARVGGDTARQLDESAAEARAGLRAHAAEAGAEVRQQADRTAASLQAEAGVLTAGLAATATAATSGIGQAAATTTDQLRRHGAEAGTHLAAAEADTTQALDARADEQRGRVAAAGAAAVTGLRRQAVRAAEQSARAQAQAVERVSAARLDERTGADIAAEAGARLTESHETAATGARGVGDGVTAELGRTGERGAAELAGAASEVRGRFAAAADRFGAEAARVGSTATGAMAGAARAATAAGDEAIAATGRGLDGVVAAADSGFGEAAGAVDRSLADRTAETGERAREAVAGSRDRIAEGHNRVEARVASHVPVQRSVLSAVGDWFAEQLADLWNMMKSPSFWVGLVVALVLFPFMGPGSLVIAGFLAGFTSGIEDNLRNGRPWWDPDAIIRHAFIGTLAGAAMAFGIGVIIGLGLEGLAALGATMALSAVVGIVTNVATGERWDRGLLANLFLAWLFHRIFAGRARPPAEETPPPGGRSGDLKPGLYSGIDPARPPTGWRFVDTVTRRGNNVTVETEVVAPDGSTGTMGRSVNTSNGTFSMDYAFLDQIPKALRMVATEPEMLPGQGTPLEAYMTMRQMRILEQQAGASFAGPRTVHMSTIINARTVMELAALEAGGTPRNQAILSTHSVQYARNSIIQSGGRISHAEVVGGRPTRAADVHNGEPARYGVDPNAEVLYGFDIDIHVVPADAPVTPSGPGGPVPVPVGPGSDQGDEP